MNQKQKKELPDTLYHISVVSPDKMEGNKIKSSTNITIEGEKVSAIWADAISADDNPYSARIKDDGMFCIGDIVLYHKSNIEHSEENEVNILGLKEPLYQYEVSSEGFQKIERGGTVEYIKRNAEIDLKDTNIRKIEDVSGVCYRYQLFSNVSGNSDLTKKFMNDVSSYINETGDLAGGYKKTSDFLKQQIAKGNILYHNEYVSVNEKSEYCKEGIEEYIKSQENKINKNMDLIK